MVCPLPRYPTSAHVGNNKGGFDMSVSMYNSSITHTFGNVACVAMDYIKDYFSQNYFKTVHISTKMAHRQLNVFRSKKEFWKNDKPMLIMRPRIEMDDSSKFFYGSAMTNRVMSSKVDTEFSNTVALLEDKGYGVMLRFNWNRLKIYYDVSIVVDSYNEQLNLVHALQNNMAPNVPFYISTCLESYMPRAMMDSVRNHLNIKEEDIAEVLYYMNTYSKTPINYKFKNGSGNSEYFMLYPTNIETIVSDFSIDDGDGRGLIKDVYTISFSMSTEFNAVGNWYAFLMDGSPRYDIIPTESELEESGYDPSRVIPIHSIPLSYDLKLEPGWVVFNDMSPMFFIKDYVPEGECDITDISQVIQKPIQKVIRHHLGMNIPLDTVLRFKCFKDRKEMPYGRTGYEIDLDNLCIRTYDCDPDATYRLFILVNNHAINSCITEITKFSEES